MKTAPLAFRILLLSFFAVSQGGAFAAEPMPAPPKPVAKKPAPAKTPPKKTATVGSSGTAQMKGGDGIFGETYTLTGGGPNFALVSAEYSVERFNVSPETAIMPLADEKLLILHMRVKNPSPQDKYLGHSFVTFATVARDDQTRDGINDSRLMSAKSVLENTLKPGQGFTEDVVTACVVPAQGAVPKLILNAGRAGTTETVTRYFLGTGKNLVKPLPAIFADASDPSGATALGTVPAKMGMVYPLGHYDMSLDSVAFVVGPLGEKTAEDGKRFVVATVTLTNKTWGQNYFKGYLDGTLVTSDDEKDTNFTQFKGKRNEEWEGRQIEPGETFTIRLVFAEPKDISAKSLTLLEEVDNSGHKTRAYVYDLSVIK